MPYKNRQDALDYAKKYRTNPETRKNIKDGQRAWYLQKGDRIKQKERDRHQFLRENALKELGGKCVRCGTIENLEFNHIDPSLKTQEASTKTGLRQKEYQKCELLCKPCHRQWSNAEARLSRKFWLESLSTEERRKRIREAL